MIFRSIVAIYVIGVLISIIWCRRTRNNLSYAIHWPLLIALWVWLEGEDYVKDKWQSFYYDRLIDKGRGTWAIGGIRWKQDWRSVYPPIELLGVKSKEMKALLKLDTLDYKYEHPLTARWRNAFSGYLWQELDPDLIWQLYFQKL